MQLIEGLSQGGMKQNMGTTWHSCTFKDSSEAQRETVARTRFCHHMGAVDAQSKSTEEKTNLFCRFCHQIKMDDLSFIQHAA